MALTVAAIETAITAIQSGGQSVTVDGFSYTAASLGALIALRDRLVSETSRSGATRPLFRAFNFRSAGYNTTSDSTPQTVLYPGP